MSSRKPESRNSSTVLALMGVLFVTGGFLAFIAILLPGLAAVAIAFFMLVSLQYLVWGWWFPKRLSRDDGED